MTEIAFHFNVADKLQYSCRLLRKANATGAQLVVTGDAGLLNQLDHLLWTFSATEFLPHCRVGEATLAGAVASVTTLAATPVQLADSPEDSVLNGVLVNLGTEIPRQFERFERFIELVTSDQKDRQAARQRWKHYADRGYVMKTHDLAAAADAA